MVKGADVPAREGRTEEAGGADQQQTGRETRSSNLPGRLPYLLESGATRGAAVYRRPNLRRRVEAGHRVSRPEAPYREGDVEGAGGSSSAFSAALAKGRADAFPARERRWSDATTDP
jgi:hypothetical protein